MKNKYFSLVQEGNEVDIYIFGDIVSWEWLESDVSSYTLAKTIAALTDVSTINVHINSYGGEVAEGLAIHNSLKNHKAKIVTICDGFACSAASIVFMAGESRLMNPASLLMIHNAWSYAAGNAEQLRKVADDLEKISSTAAQAYKDCINISDKELEDLLNNESWITPADAVKWGFATEIKASVKTDKAAASALTVIMHTLTNPRTEPTAAEETLNQIKQDVAAIKAAISLQPKEPKQEPTSAPKQESKGENKPMTFFNALLGGKEEK